MFFIENVIVISRLIWITEPSQNKKLALVINNFVDSVLLFVVTLTDEQSS